MRNRACFVTPRGLAGRLAILAAGVFAVTSSLTATAAVAEPGEVRVDGKYTLLFNGLSVGSYKIVSAFDGASYSTRSRASLSALFGAFTWKGQISASGILRRLTPQPKSFEMSFKGKSKRSLVRLSFGKEGVDKVEVRPEKPPKPDSVPITAAHKANVYDPMAAIVAISKSARDKPCAHNLPVFDGRKRFDLVFSYKGTERVSGKDGRGEQLTVCRVRYVLVAGHRKKEVDDAWVDYDNIEIAMRYVPSAEIFVPYRIKIPTTIGAAEMRIADVRITQPNQPAIAFTN